MKGLTEGYVYRTHEDIVFLWDFGSKMGSFRGISHLQKKRQDKKFRWTVGKDEAKAVVKQEQVLSIHERAEGFQGWNRGLCGPMSFLVSPLQLRLAAHLSVKRARFQVAANANTKMCSPIVLWNLLRREREWKWISLRIWAEKNSPSSIFPLKWRIIFVMCSFYVISTTSHIMYCV